MNRDVYFYDSYALIEVFKGNPQYEKYATGTYIITTYFQLYEVYFNLIKVYPESMFLSFFETVKTCCISLDFDWIKEAAQLRLANKKKDLSYADCLGYVTAKNKNVKFLTGDKEFKGLPNVEFVK